MVSKQWNSNKENNQMSKSKYRKELKKTSKEAPYTAWTLRKWWLLALIVLALFTFSAQTLGIIPINIQRKVTRHN